MSLSRGFTLPELLLSVSLGSLITLAACAVLTQTAHQIVCRQQQTYLLQAMQHSLQRLSKDLRRAGFIYPLKTATLSPYSLPLSAPLIIGQHTNEAAHSCVLLYYDLNRNGIIDSATVNTPAETFGYRLHQGNLETQRGVTDCNSPRWEDLFDPHLITVERFQIIRPTGASWITVILSARLIHHPDIIQTLQSVLVLENLLCQ